MCNKKHLNFDLYKRAVFNNERIRCTQQRFKSDHDKIYTQNIRKIALNDKDHKRIQSFDGITTNPIGMDQDWWITKKMKDQYNYIINKKVTIQLK